MNDQTQVMARLVPHLPDEHRASPDAALRSLVVSPQFQQQMESLSRALDSGQLDIAQVSNNGLMV